MKDLIENKNDLKEKAINIINSAKEENRAVTNEEKKVFDNIMEEIKDIENKIEMEERINKMEKKEIKVENITKEEKEVKAMAELIRKFSNAETNFTKGDNGAIIPSTIAKKIIDKVAELSPLYASATKYNSKGVLIIPAVDDATDDIQADYQEEFAELTSHASKFKTVSLTGFLVGALTKISKSLLNNNDIDLVNYVVNAMAIRFAKFYEKEMLYGTTNKVAGIVGSYDKNGMKVALAKKSTITADELIDIQELIPDVYQVDAYWIMNRKTRKAIRKLKDKQDNYLLNQVFGKAWDFELLGKPVKCSENAKELGIASKEVIFYGDFSGLAVKEAETLEINVLTEKYATQHAIGVCGYAEFDSKVENTQKIAVAVSGSAD